MATEEKVLRWGILGSGQICNDFVLALDKAEHKHKVVAIAASSESRASDFIVKHNILEAKPYGSYDELLKDDNIDVVYIGLRNFLHQEFTVKALEAGKNVLCEKPFGLNLKQSEAMLEAAEKSGKLLVEGYWTLHFPIYRELDKILKEKAYGDVFNVEASFGYSLPSDFVNLERGETMLTTLGCYTIMIANFVYKTEGRIVDVDWERNDHGADKRTKLTLSFGEDKKAILRFDETQPLENKLKVNCKEALIEVDAPFWCPTKLTITTENGINTRECPLNDNRKEFNYPNSSGLRYEADHVYEMIFDNKTESNIVPLRFSRQVQKTVDEVRKVMGIEFPVDT
ncbi:unnamed protein product [Bursaphelenchus okinawaensis]|uniref:Trans-1,2-dihydrobenzene-1,2-diol dehydrogenase n=1 Tax=Bursaphelenchus okinawaensis TaxID=465554 RepID=A0A811KB61_9BILA|nr:unnamed protein product [Bursaphelenchus okinawaensis]CAG9096896.1 unnamed protein product [Bursaphelenchus okinawaensis]